MVRDRGFQQDYRDRLLSLARGYMGSRIFLSALELGIFEGLGNQRLTALQLAERLGSDPRATEILLNALAGMEILEKNDNEYANIKEIADLVIPGRSGYQGAMFYHTANGWERWSHLTEIVKSGHPGEWAHGERVDLDLALAMREQAAGKIHWLGSQINVSGARLILDLGGGPGTHGIAFAKRYPHLSVVIFDRSKQAGEIARSEIKNQNLEDRVKFVRGDFFRDDIGRGYDLVFLSYIVCLFGKEENAILLNKAKGSLKEGGRIVVWDPILDDSKTRPPGTAIFSVNMLVNTPNGRSYSFPELKCLLMNAGFRDVYRSPVGRSQVVVGIK